MSTLIELLPDLVFLMRRDGTVIAHGGGSGVPELRLSGDAAWSPITESLLKQLVRRSISQRTAVEARFQEGGRDYDVRVTPQGPDRAIGSVRGMLTVSKDVDFETTVVSARPELDRRGFLRRLKESMSMAALREQSLAVAVLHIDGIPDIARVIGARLSEQIMSRAILRLLAQHDSNANAQPKWYVGQLSENVLGMMIDTGDRDAIEACIARVCESLREPIAVGDAEYSLTPYAGAGLLGLDASSPVVLLDHARAAAMEAQRSASNAVVFYSADIQAQALARLDMAGELREAIASKAIRFRYIGRHDLMTGKLVALVGYLRWRHPLRGEIRPAEFLRLAESTGMAIELSRAALEAVRTDFASLRTQCAPEVRISFGALRDHVFHQQFLTDIEALLDAEALPAQRLELRISEKAFVTRDASDFRSLQQRGVQVVVDEAGRDMSSLAALARSRVAGWQLDRSWVTAVLTDEIANKVCRAGIGMAKALGLTPLAVGIDDELRRQALLEMGCRFGSGDLYARPVADITTG